MSVQKLARVREIEHQTMRKLLVEVRDFIACRNCGSSGRELTERVDRFLAELAKPTTAAADGKGET